MKQFLVVFSAILLTTAVIAQKKKLDHISIAFTTMHTAFPFGNFSNLFTKEFHPGFEAGTGFNWKTREKHAWFQSFEAGYSYHRFVQHSLALYSEFGYRYKFSKSFSADAKIGTGYLHTIPVGKIFKLQDDGTYKKKTNLGRPQAMAAFTVGINKKFASGFGLFMNYQQRVQLPFIKSYVPLLPSNMILIGTIIPFHNINKHSKK